MPAPLEALVRHVMHEAHAKNQLRHAAAKCAELAKLVVEANKCGDHARAVAHATRRKLVYVRALADLLEMQADLDAVDALMPVAVAPADQRAMRDALLALTPEPLRLHMCTETPGRAVAVVFAGGRCELPELGDRGMLDLWSSGFMSPAAGGLEMHTRLMSAFIERRGLLS